MFRMNKHIALCFMMVLLVVKGSYVVSNNIYVGAFAFCSNSCTAAENSGCPGKCITFRDNAGGYNIRTHQYLAEKCWLVNSCAEFPKFFAFQTDTQCQGGCEVNAFPGFSINQLNQNKNLYNAKGYNMMCIEQSSSDSPFPNICQLARPYAVAGTLYQVELKMKVFMFIASLVAVFIINN